MTVLLLSESACGTNAKLCFVHHIYIYIHIYTYIYTFTKNKNCYVKKEPTVEIRKKYYVYKYK